MQTNQDVNKESSKQKLTLAIDRNVIEKAKAAGINISSITEQVLKAMTYQPNEGNTRDDVVRAYQAILDEARSVMSKHIGGEFQITVGKVKSKIVFLNSAYGLILWNGRTKDTIDAKPSVDRVLGLLYKPNRIIENLLVALTEEEEYNNKEKISEVKFALRLVKALSDDGEDDKK
jgi:hypothetical protein